MTIKVLAKGEKRASITIYGVIGFGFFEEGVTAEKVRKDLDALGEVTDIDVFINSPGGNVFDSLAITNILSQHPAQVHVHVDGLAASGASVIAMAGDLITMGQGATMMIHSPSTLFEGSAEEMRGMADVLDTVESGMLDIYEARTGKSRDEVLALVRAETWFTAQEAVDAGFADDMVASKPRQKVAASWQPIMACFRHTPATLKVVAGAKLASLLNNAIDEIDANEDDERSRADVIGQMATAAGISEGTVNEILNNEISCPPLNRLEGFASVDGLPALAAQRSAAESDGCEYDDDGQAKACTITPKSTTTPPQVTAVPPMSAHADAIPKEGVMPNRAPASVQDADKAAIVAAERTRTAEITALCGKFGMDAGFTAKAVADGLSKDQVNGLILDKLATATHGGTFGHAELTEDEHDKMRAQASDWLTARAGFGQHKDDNPFRGMTIENVAREVLEANGVRTRGMGREAVINAAITHSTGDFPNIFENALNKSMLNAFQVIPVVWPKIARVTTLTDFRPHIRYRIGSFSDLERVLENGEYKDGTIGDAERETITAISKGRILNISREMMVNDDMGVFTDAARFLGQASARAPEKDLLALFASNGPTMGDTKALFHADHGNIAASGTPPTMAAFEAMRVQMGSQLDPSGNDFVDVRPSIWLGPLSLSGTAKQTNAAEFDDEAQKNQRKPNISRGLVRDIVDTPRLPATIWYLLADPAVEPVFEVGFLDGQQTPQLEMQESFRSGGISWRIRYEYGVAAVGWRGIVKNAGA